jgi:hypothetical protein
LTSKTWISFHNLSLGTDENYYFSVFIDNFCDLIAVESVG